MPSASAFLKTMPDVISEPPTAADVEPTDLLVAAIKSGNVAACRSILAQFPDAVNGKDSLDGATPAHWCALHGNVEILEEIHDQGVRLDQVVDASGMQPLHWASTHGHTNVVRFLIGKAGCNVDALDVKKTTPLVIAAQYDHSVLVFYLANARADITLLDECNDSALHWAAYKGNQQTTALLHYLGLPADAADAYGSTPLHLAAMRNAPHVIEYLLDESSTDAEKLIAARCAQPAALTWPQYLRLTSGSPQATQHVSTSRSPHLLAFLTLPHRPPPPLISSLLLPSLPPLSGTTRAAPRLMSPGGAAIPSQRGCSSAPLPHCAHAS